MNYEGKKLRNELWTTTNWTELQTSENIIILPNFPFLTYLDTGFFLPSFLTFLTYFARYHTAGSQARLGLDCESLRGYDLRPSTWIAFTSSNIPH